MTKAARCCDDSSRFTGRATPALPGYEVVILTACDPGKGDDGCDYRINRQAIHAWGEFRETLTRHHEDVDECPACGRSIDERTAWRNLRALVVDGGSAELIAADTFTGDVLLGVYRVGEQVEPELIADARQRARKARDAAEARYAAAQGAA